MNVYTTDKFDIISFATDQYLSEAIRSIDARLGDGYAKKNPQLISTLVTVMDRISGRNDGNIVEFE